MSATCYLKVFFYIQVKGNRPGGQPRKRWIYCIKEDCEDLGIKLVEATWRSRTKDQAGWKKAVGAVYSCLVAVVHCQR